MAEMSRHIFTNARNALFMRSDYAGPSIIQLRTQQQLNRMNKKKKSEVDPNGEFYNECTTSDDEITEDEETGHAAHIKITGDFAVR